MIADMQEYRCQCGKLLFKGLMFVSLVEIKCLRCGTIQIINEMSSGFLGEDKYAFLYNEDGSILNASISANQILGYSPDELQKMSIYQINRCITPGLHKKFWNLRIYESGTLFAKLFPLKKDGCVIPVLGEYKFYKQGNGAHYIFATYQNFKVDDPLIFEEPNFLGFGKNNEELFLEINGDGICLKTDARVKKLLGYQPEELINHPLFKICKPMYKDPGSLRKLTAQRTSFDVPNNTFLCRNGKVVNSESYFSCKYNDEGDFIGYRVFNWL